MIEQISVSPTDPSLQLPEAYYRLLCLIEEHPEYSQRQLAQAMGVSLGKAHYLLKALFERGLVKAGEFNRRADKMALLYRVTPTGVRQRVKLAKAFLHRKEAEFELLRSEIAKLRASLAMSATDSQVDTTT